MNLLGLVCDASHYLVNQVQPQVDPALKPRVVHRGLEGLPDIPDGETDQVESFWTSQVNGGRFRPKILPTTCRLTTSALLSMVLGLRATSSSALLLRYCL